MQNLSWSHFKLIMRLSDKDATNNWSVRTLDRNISTLYYQRLLSSQIIDLVFYYYILKCFVLIELKTTKITH